MRCGTNDTYDYAQGRMSATIVPWPKRALKLRIEVNTSLVIKLGPWTVYGTSVVHPIYAIIQKQ